MTTETKVKETAAALGLNARVCHEALLYLADSSQMKLPQSSEELWLRVESIRRVLKRQERSLQKKLALSEASVISRGGSSQLAREDLTRQRAEFQQYLRESEALSARLQRQDPELFDFCIRLRDEPTAFPLHSANEIVEVAAKRDQRVAEIVTEHEKQK